MLWQAAKQYGVSKLALELGGGITTYPDDIERGIRAIFSLLAFWGFLPQEYRLNPTPQDRIYFSDKREFFYAWEEGAFYTMAKPGEMFDKGERIGTWISLEDFKAVPVTAVVSGLLIYSRTRCRSHKGDTITMFLPGR